MSVVTQLGVTTDIHVDIQSLQTYMSLQTYCRVTTDILLTHTGMGKQYVCSDSTRQDTLWLHTVMSTSHTGMGKQYVCSDSTRQDTLWLHTRMCTSHTS